MEFIYLRIKTGANAGYGTDRRRSSQGTGNDVRIVGVCSKGFKDHMVPLVNNVALGLIEQNNINLQLGYHNMRGTMCIEPPSSNSRTKQLEHENSMKEPEE